MFVLIIFIDKTQYGSYFKKTAIFFPLLAGYAIIWFFFYINSWFFSNSIIDFSNGLIRYSILSIFIIFSGIVKLITQRDKSLFLKIYRIWVSVESVISILLGNFILILSLIEFRDFSFLFYVCMGLAASSNIVLAITGVRSIKEDGISMSWDLFKSWSWFCMSCRIYSTIFRYYYIFSWSSCCLAIHRTW